MAFHPGWCDRDETGMIGVVSGMKTPENGRVGESRGQSPGNGSGGDCFKMFKTIGVNRREYRESCVAPSNVKMPLYVKR